MLKQVADTIARYGMLEPGGEVLVALSGGADSVALLRVLLALGYRARAFHLNHCLRGDEAERDEDFVRTLCASLGVPLAVRRADIRTAAAARGESIETAARHLRYQMLAEDARGARIATAHTADDNVETVLFHLTRGTGPKGLGGIPPVRGAIVRPLLETGRAEIENYLASLGQPFVTDSTNFSVDYTRNRIRHEVVPVLRDINPALCAAINRLTALARQDEACLENLAGKALENARRPGGFLVNTLLEADGAVRSRALRLLLAEAGVPPRQTAQRHIALLEGLLRADDPSAVLDLPGGYRAHRIYETFAVQKTEEPTQFDQIPLSVPFHGPVGHSGTWLTLDRKEKNSAFYNSFNTFCVDCGKINFETLSVRARKAGDRLRLTDGGGSRTLKKLMIDRRIPREERDRLAVVADRDGVIAVEGLGMDCSRRSLGGDSIEIRFERI